MILDYKMSISQILHVDFGFDYFPHNKLDEPDLNLVFILDFYLFRGLQSNVQASLRYGKHYIKKYQFMDFLKLP